MAEKSEKQLVVGILAHVDSGKTTLSEAMLYRAGSIRKLGRVDNKDAFLDTDTLEKARGITIFSKQALLKTGSTSITLLDTPGHVDFSTETERTLQVLDYAVLVISGTDGVQSHTETLWRLLRRYHIPTFVFINKMDLPGPGKEALLSQLSHRLGDGFVDFGAEQAERDEALALCDERLMEKMLDAGSLTAEDIIPAIARRHVFPCWFGVALQRENAGGLQGVDELLAGLDEYTRAAPALEAFGARVFKVSQDERGERLTWLRVTGGELKVKAQLTGEADGEPWAEKANQLRLYSGAKYTLAEAIGPGQVCAVTGLTRAKPGTGLGAERDSDLPMLEPILSYRVCLPEGADVHAALGKLHRLEEEEPQLHVVWNETLGEIHVQLMGEIQLEVLKSLLAERYGLDVEFDSGGILYKETITEAIEGVDMICLPEVPFNVEHFVEKVRVMQEKKPSIVIAVSEGVKLKDGRYVCELADDVHAVDAFGHKALTGTARYLANVVARNLDTKTRCIELSTLQRCAGHLTSRTDITEAYQVGGAAVKAAFEGVTGQMVALKRISNSPYQCTTELHPISEVANLEKKVPLSWMNENHTQMTEDFLAYARPLIQAELTPLYIAGLPHHIYMKPQK